MKGLLLAAGAALMGTAGCTSVTAPVDAAGTMFEIEYVNYAWFPTWHGFVIDAEGRIHSYDLKGEEWRAVDDEYVSAPELQAKWARNSASKGTVEADALRQMVAHVSAAADGGLSQPQNRCADAGVITYSAYRYEPQRARFRRVVVRREGDVAQASRSAAGRTIADWLVSLRLIQGFSGCQP